MTPNQAIQTALTQIADLRLELAATRQLTLDNRHLGNETQVSIEQN